jgi:hypothetical protein
MSKEVICDHYKECKAKGCHHIKPHTTVDFSAILRRSFATKTTCLDPDLCTGLTLSFPVRVRCRALKKGEKLIYAY